MSLFYRLSINSLLAFIIALSAIAFSSESRAQGTSEGTEFWFGFPDNSRDIDTEYGVFITSRFATSGTLSIPNHGFEATFSIVADSTAKIVVPRELALLYVSEEITDKAIHITAENPVCVHFIVNESYATDGSIVLPIRCLSNSYIITDYQPTYYRAVFLVVANEDSTDIVIQPTQKLLHGHEAGTSILFTLNRGQMYQVISDSSMTGTMVYSTNNKKFSVFAGDQCINIPYGYDACNYAIDQLLPVNYWRKKYIASMFATRTGGSLFRIVAKDNNTIVSINGIPWKTLYARGYADTVLKVASVISSTKPIGVTQFSTGFDYDETNSDPFMICLSPIDFARKEVVFPTNDYPTIP